MVLNSLRLRIRRALPFSSSFPHHSLLPPKTISSVASLLSIPTPTAIPVPAPTPTFSQYPRLFISTSALFQKAFDPETDEIGPDTILFEGCDYNHWLITVNFRKDVNLSREQMIETYVNIAAQVFGRESLNCVRRISTPAWSVESTLPVCCRGCFGYGNQGKHYFRKLLPQISYGSCSVSGWPVERSCMSKLHSLSIIRGYSRATSYAPIELNTEEDVIRFDIGNEHHGRGSSRKAKKTAREAMMSRKAKLNELRFYRLKAKKKMNSPNPEVRIRYKLEKAKRKEAWLIEKLRKYELPKASRETYDPEILTEEERFYLKRTGEKKKHYVPVGRRGVFGGVVLNMHLHWKRHETVKVICKPCRPGQINQYAEELSRLSKGIIIDIKPNNIIIFYRGKNYVQPNVMSPPDTLSKAKALEKYRYEQSLEHTSKFIEKLENELEEYYEHLARYKR